MHDPSRPLRGNFDIKIPELFGVMGSQTVDFWPRLAVCSPNGKSPRIIMQEKSWREQLKLEGKKTLTYLLATLEP